MKKKLGLFIALLVLTLSGCGSQAEASDVHSVDDLEGKKIGLYGFRTHYGKIDMSLTYDDGTYAFELKTERPIEKKLILHLPLNENDIKDIEIDAVNKTEISYRFSI